MDSGTGRVFTAKGVSGVTLTLKHWELKQQATLTADEAQNLGYELIKRANEVRYDPSERALAAKLAPEPQEEDFSDLA